METARPAVDRYVLDLLAARPLRGSDFAETSKGQCRIMPTLARQLATTTPAWAGDGRAACGARRQAARRRRWTRHTTDNPHRQHPAGGPTQRQSNPAGPSAQADGAGASVPRLRSGCPRRAAPLRELPRHRECCEAPRTPGPWNSRAPGDREPSIHTSRRPGKHRRRPTRAVASSPPGHRYRLHRPPVGVPAPHPPTPRRRPARRPRPRYGALTRLLRPDPRRPACATCSPLGGVPARRPQRSPR